MQPGRRFGLLAAIAPWGLLLSMAVANAARAQTPPRATQLPVARAVQAKDGYAYLPGSAEMVASARVMEVIPNPTGRYALLIRKEEPLPPGWGGKNPARPRTLSLVLWDSLARRALTLWQQTETVNQNMTRLEAHWLPGTDCIVAIGWVDPDGSKIVEGANAASALLFADVTRDAHMRPLLSSQEPIDLLVPRSHSVAVVRARISRPTGDGTMVYDHSELRTVDASGRLGAPANLPKADATFLEWRAAESKVQVTALTRTTPPTDATSPRTSKDRSEISTDWLVYDTGTGRIEPLAKGPLDETHIPAPAVSPLPLLLNERPIPIPNLDGSPPDSMLNSLWLAAAGSKGVPLLLASDAEKPVLLPDLSAVLYESGHALYAIPLVRVNGTDDDDAAATAMKRMLMGQAQEIAFAIKAYASSHDGQLPIASDVTKALSPYVMSSDVFRNPVTNAAAFRYYQNGGVLQALGAPVPARIGSLSGPDGQAVILGDGSVFWEYPPAPKRK